LSRQDETAVVYASRNGGDIAFNMVTEAIADIYLLSQASVFVGSTSSTFGTFSSQCGMQTRGPGGGPKRLLYIDGADIASGMYKCPVTSYMLLSSHNFETVSKILLDETGTAVFFNLTSGIPQYKVDVVKHLFPPFPVVKEKFEFARTVDNKLLAITAITPRKADTILRYDIASYPFAEIIKKVIAPTVQDLTFIHKVQSIDNVAMQLEATDLNPLNGSMSEFHNAFYLRLNADDNWPEFMQVWLKFVKEVVMPVFPNTVEIAYQKKPTLRVQLPGSATVFSLHSDGDPTNLHPAGEVNFILPLTSGCGNSASTWVESLPFLGDYHPLSMEYGHLNVFDGNRCR